MTSNPQAPSSFWNPNPPPVNAIPSPTPASFYTETAAFNLVYYGALAVAPTTDPFGNAVLTGALYYNTTAQALYVFTGTLWVPYAPTTAILDFTFTAAANGVVLWRRIPFNAQVLSWTILANATATAVLDVQRVPLNLFNPPTRPAAGDTIVTTQPPTLTSAKSSASSGSFTWSTLNTGDVVAAVLSSVSPPGTQVYLQLNLLRT